MSVRPRGLALYRLLARLSAAVPLPDKARASIVGRRAAAADWTAWRAANPKRKITVWVHAASVGESLVARPVIRRLLAALPGTEVVMTCSSPSLAEWPQSTAAGRLGYVPLESPGAVAAVFDAIQPDMLAFARADVWPGLALAAQERRVPVAVFGATVRAKSGRLRWPVRRFLRHVLGDVRFVGACTRADAERWARLGIPEGVIAVTGDPRHDEVLERVTDLRPVMHLLPWADAPALVAGSVETGDVSPLIEGLALVKRTHGTARLLIVPHDPAPHLLTRIQSAARRAGVACAIANSTGPQPQVPCLVLPLRGVLADLYCLGGAAYVGGGFRAGGLHSVIEPAAFGIPVLFGPRYQWSPDATALVAKSGGVPLPARGTAGMLARQWGRWLDLEAERNRAGAAARRILHQGAAAVTARHLLALLPSRAAAPD